MTDSEMTETDVMSISELQDIFHFSNADILANRSGHYSLGQHRLLGAAAGLIAFAVLVLLSWPIQREAGRAMGFVAGLCLGALDLVALLAGISGLAALWNTARESRVTPIVTYEGYVDSRQSKDERWSLISDSFTIPVDAEAGEQFRAGLYRVYYVPKFVNDRDNLFSMEPLIETAASSELPSSAPEEAATP